MQNQTSHIYIYINTRARACVCVINYCIIVTEIQNFIKELYLMTTNGLSSCPITIFRCLCILAQSDY